MHNPHDKIPRTICQGAIALGLVANCSAGDKPSPAEVRTVQTHQAAKEPASQPLNPDEKLNKLALEIAQVRRDIQKLELEKKLDTEKRAASRGPSLWRNCWRNCWRNYEGPSASPSPDTAKEPVMDSLQKLKSKLGRLEKELEEATRVRTNKKSRKSTK